MQIGTVVVQITTTSISYFDLRMFLGKLIHRRRIITFSIPINPVLSDAHVASVAFGTRSNFKFCSSADFYCC